VTENRIDDASNLFIRRWGEMGATWGISRTMAEVHALLYLATEPLCTDDVIERLAISRGSASMNLRDLVNWGLVERIHRRGDRKEYFEAEKDVWQMFETISRERRRREVLPIMETIERCLAMIDERPADFKGRDAKYAEDYRKRFNDIYEFCQLLDTLFNVIAKGGRDGVKPLLTTIASLVS
jgi:DNA-binding transcriptional regulator GbsR (MarR family)